jgi:hypothetical protein
LCRPDDADAAGAERMKRILFLITVAALALAALLSALKLAGSEAAHAGSAPPCASEITATGADGHGSRDSS